jgi:hypothetical protein
MPSGITLNVIRPSVAVPNYVVHTKLMSTSRRDNYAPVNALSALLEKQRMLMKMGTGTFLGTP